MHSTGASKTQWEKLPAGQIKKYYIPWRWLRLVNLKVLLQTLLWMLIDQKGMIESLLFHRNLPCSVVVRNWDRRIEIDAGSISWVVVDPDMGLRRVENQLEDQLSGSICFIYLRIPAPHRTCIYSCLRILNTPWPIRQRRQCYLTQSLFLIERYSIER